MRRLGSWLRAMVFRRHHRDEIDAELRSHLHEEVESLVGSGVARSEAERRARAQFGNLKAIQEECREARGTRIADVTVQDLRHGLRILRRYPAFSLTAVLTLALTVGAVSTVLTVLSTFYFQRWNVQHPKQIVEVQATRNEGTRIAPVSWAEYVHFRDATRTLQNLAAAYTTAPLHITTDDDAFDLTGAAVSANLFPMLGLEPAAGRFFRAEEDSIPGRDPVAVISHEFWRRWYGGEPGAMGATLVINGTGFEVIGLVPAAFTGFDAAPVQIYMPTMMLGVGYRWCSVLEDIDCTILQMFGRLADGASAATVEAEMQSLHPTHWAAAERGDNSGTAVRQVRGMYQSGVDEQFMSLLMIVAGVLFLVCCANLAGLLISRGRARTAELALRASLGASRRRLVRQLLTEALVLATVGGGLGVLLSVLLTRLLQARFYLLDSSGRPLVYDFGLRPEIVGATFLVALVAGLLFVLLPAWGLVRRTVTLERVASAGRTSAPVHRWLLGLQAASAVALVVLASLLSVSVGARAREANIEPSRVALLRLRPRLMEYSPEQAQRYLRDAVDRLEALPGVESVSAVGTGIALMGFVADVSVSGTASEGSGTEGSATEGNATGDNAAEAPTAATRVGYIEIGPRYFETLGTPVLRGPRVRHRRRHHELTGGGGQRGARTAAVDRSRSARRRDSGQRRRAPSGRGGGGRTAAGAR